MTIKVMLLKEDKYAFVNDEDDTVKTYRLNDLIVEATNLAADIAKREIDTAKDAKMLAWAKANYQDSDYMQRLREMKARKEKIDDLIAKMQAVTK
jgi:hypothetical protein